MKQKCIQKLNVIKKEIWVLVFSFRCLVLVDVMDRSFFFFFHFHFFTFQVHRCQERLVVIEELRLEGISTQLEEVMKVTIIQKFKSYPALHRFAHGPP